MDTVDTIKNVLKKYVNKHNKVFVNPNNVSAFETELNNIFGDRRYTVQILAGSDKSGKFLYRNVMYYYYVWNKNEIDFEIDLHH